VHRLDRERPSPEEGDDVRHVLVVCTANVCRSPVIEALLQRRLGSSRDTDGRRWLVTSAGTRVVSRSPHQHTIDAARSLGVDVSDHVPRQLTAEVLRSDGADLVIAAAREHVRAILALDSDALPRTFTLRELVRRSGETFGTGGFEEWIQAVGAGRRPAMLVGPDGDDDIVDPYGLARPKHEEMITRVDRLVRRLAISGPWDRAELQRNSSAKALT
jgi:protein-tyrosine phosphatase